MRRRADVSDDVVHILQCILFPQEDDFSRIRSQVLEVISSLHRQVITDRDDDDIDTLLSNVLSSCGFIQGTPLPYTVSNNDFHVGNFRVEGSISIRDKKYVIRHQT